MVMQEKKIRDQEYFCKGTRRSKVPRDTIMPGGVTMEKSRAIVMKANDNVATAVEEITPGTKLDLNVEGQEAAVLVTEKIPFGHKFAIRDIAKEEKVIKYGEPIGTANREIKAGQHTHIHNMEGCRGRGDLGGE
jgi:altronate dehydratase small subunit